MNAAHKNNSRGELSGNGGFFRLFAHFYTAGFLFYILFFYLFRQKFTAVAAAIICNSLLTILFYHADKGYAQSGAKRIPEKMLHLWELAGGWPGALIAQVLFHHKTKKFSFLALSYLMIALHILLLWGCNYILVKLHALSREITPIIERFTV